MHCLIPTLGMGIVAAPRLELFTQLICRQVNHDISTSSPADLPIFLLNPDQCRQSPTVQRHLAELNLFLQIIMGILCILTTPFWGALSDRIGRKTVLVLNMLSFVLGDVILITVISFPSQIPYFWLLLYPAFEGLFAGLGGGQAIMSAYVRFICRRISPQKNDKLNGDSCCRLAIAQNQDHELALFHS